MFKKVNKDKKNWDVLTEREQDPYIDYVYYLIENKYIYDIGTRKEILSTAKKIYNAKNED